MDLLDADFAQLKTIAKLPNITGWPLVFVLHGDRHIWDELDETCPIYAKLKSIFFYSGLFFICPEKLDPNSVDLVVRHVMNAINTPPCTQEKRIASIARLLKKRPKWNGSSKHLGFYDGTTGQSQLCAVAAKTKKTVLRMIQELELNSLELNHAALKPEQLNGHRYIAKKVDFIGNCLNFASIWSICPDLEWMNLAANELSVVDAHMCPSTLRHLYLHKNEIDTLHIPTGLLCKLRSLSVYRNRLTELKLPEDQTQLVKLNLGANPITNLPETLQNSRDLEFLGLARTRICTLPGWLFEMPKLKEVDLSHMQHLIPKLQIQRLMACGVNIIFEPGNDQYAIRI